MNPESSPPSTAEDFLRKWRRATLVMQLWASAAIFFAAASAWQVHRWSRVMYDIYTPPPGVERNYKLVHRIGDPLLQEALLDAVLALLALAGTVYYFWRRKRL
ncbi:MAG: hypothetical protein JWO82_107, partial [Akkermansiaceae bacterium]|nr:hypothetical protein [Akkermansiaceae bacterium]